MEEVIRQIVYSLEGEVLTSERCEAMVREIVKGLGEYQEFEESKDFFEGQPIPTDD